MQLLKFINENKKHSLLSFATCSVFPFVMSIGEHSLLTSLGISLYLTVFLSSPLIVIPCYFNWIIHLNFMRKQTKEKTGSFSVTNDMTIHNISPCKWAIEKNGVRVTFGAGMTITLDGVSSPTQPYFKFSKKEKSLIVDMVSDFYQKMVKMEEETFIAENKESEQAAKKYDEKLEQATSHLLNFKVRLDSQPSSVKINFDKKLTQRQLSVKQ